MRERGLLQERDNWHEGPTNAARVVLGGDLEFRAAPGLHSQAYRGEPPGAFEKRRD